MTSIHATARRQTDWTTHTEWKHYLCMTATGKIKTKQNIDFIFIWEIVVSYVVYVEKKDKVRRVSRTGAKDSRAGSAMLSVKQRDNVYADTCCVSGDREHVGLLRRHDHG